MLATLQILQRKKLARAALVIAPLRPCYFVWPAEVEKWDDFRGLRVAVLHGPRKEAALRSRADVYVINPEGLPWLALALSTQNWKGDWPFDLLVVDESTKFKRSTTQRFKLLRPLLTRFRRRYILTGTPAPNGLLDLFGQIYLLDLGRALGAFITRYRLAYFYPGGYGGYEWLPQPGAEKKIYARIEPLVVQLSAKDHLKLPKLLTLPDLPPVEVTLPEKALAQYRSMEKQFFIDLGESEEAWAVNSGVASMKCRQVANGGIYTDRWAGVGELPSSTMAWRKIHDAKTEAVVDLIEELSGKPALVAFDFHHDRERLLKALGAATPVLGSGVSLRASAGIIERWNAGEIPVLLVNPQSVAHGLNLQGGRAVIFHSLTWNLEDYEQLIRRVWRQGQREAVYVYHVVAKGTIDEVIIDALGRKGAAQGRLKTALGAYRAKRGT